MVSTAAGSIRVSGTGTSKRHATARPNRSGWSIVWLAPVSRSSGGRSAVSSSSGTPLSAASTAAGSRLAAAVPDVQITAVGASAARAAFTAWYPAARSSMQIDTVSRSERAAAAANGAERAPGQTQAERQPQRVSSSMISSPHSRFRVAAVTGAVSRRARSSR